MLCWGAKLPKCLVFMPQGSTTWPAFAWEWPKKSKLVDGTQVTVGDRVIGLASSGVHSNGFSLVRKIMQAGPRLDGNGIGYSWDETQPIFGDAALGEVFLTPTRIYVKPVLAALKAELPIHGMAHITGGGLPENLPPLPEARAEYSARPCGLASVAGLSMVGRSRAGCP